MREVLNAAEAVVVVVAVVRVVVVAIRHTTVVVVVVVVIVERAAPKEPVAAAFEFIPFFPCLLSYRLKPALHCPLSIIHYSSLSSLRSPQRVKK